MLRFYEEAIPHVLQVSYNGLLWMRRPALRLSFLTIHYPPSMRGAYLQINIKRRVTVQILGLNMLHLVGEPGRKGLSAKLHRRAVSRHLSFRFSRPYLYNFRKCILFPPSPALKKQVGH